MEVVRNSLPSSLQSPLASAEASVADALGVTPDVALAVLLFLTLAALVLAASLASNLAGAGSSAGSRKSKGDAVLLLGNSGSGKTTLFYRLFADTCPECVTSMEIHEKSFPIHGAEDETSRKVIDFPGHARLRTQLPDVIPQAKCIVFVLDASAATPKDVREVASLLYDIFVECINNDCEPRMLIACNKTDVAGAAKPEDLRKKLEKELDGLKSTRHSIDTEGDDEMEIALGTEGVPFTFESDAGCEVEFTSISVLKGGEALQPVLDFICDAFE